MLWRASSRSYAVEIPKRFGPNPPTGGAKCDPHRVVIAQWACSGLGARVEKVGPVQWHWIHTLVPLSQFQSPLLLCRSTTRRSASGLRATTMCTACISLLACTAVTGAASGAARTIGCSSPRLWNHLPPTLVLNSVLPSCRVNSVLLMPITLEGLSLWLVCSSINLDIWICAQHF